jgi:multidrug efflux system membrane fusion protein
MKSAHAVAESRFKRAKDLRAKSPELVPDVQLLDEERNEQTAKAEWDIAEAQLQLLEKGPRDEVRQESQVEVNVAKLQLTYCRVTAPFAGEVIEIKTRVGQRADVGTPLITILDTSEVLVQARVPGNRLVGVWAAIKAADKKSPASIRCSSFAGEVFSAQGGWLNQQTEAQTSDVPVKLRVQNPKGLLRVGMTVQVELFEPEVECVAVPEAAISVNEEGHRVVTVIRDGKAVPTEIDIASKTEPEIRAGGWVRVIKGLDPGDVVAVENGYALPKDTPVTIQPPRP